MYINTITSPLYVAIDAGPDMRIVHQPEEIEATVS